MALTQDEGLALAVIIVGVIMGIALLWCVVWFACIRSLESSLGKTQEVAYMDPSTKPVIVIPNKFAQNSVWDTSPYAQPEPLRGSTTAETQFVAMRGLSGATSPYTSTTRILEQQSATTPPNPPKLETVEVASQASTPAPPL
mmetsp:Transcript_17191/g.44790  ORF Transcript_17191/g.44790 Transcript_17191/m.44790 type:complete len:142 (-) Transcript_17191:160-585(-)